MTIKAATPTTDLRPASKRKRSRVEHYWWISEGETARSLGIYEVPAICGRAWIKLPDTELRIKVRRSDDGVLTDDGAEDACKVCERMMLTVARREFNKRRQGRP